MSIGLPYRCCAIKPAVSEPFALEATRAQRPWWRSRRPSGGKHFDLESRSHVNDVAALLLLHVGQRSGNPLEKEADSNELQPLCRLFERRRSP